MTVIDFSSAYPAASDVKAAGHDGVMLYVSRPRQGWMKGKLLTRSIVDAYRSAGLGVGFVFQYGGAADPDSLRGFDGGKADAIEAAQKLRDVGCDDWPIYFAVDFDATLAQWNGPISDYFRGAAEVLGVQRVGIYGHSRICHWAGPEDNLVGRVGDRWLAWVTKSWSAGQTGQDYAVLYQGTHNVTGPSGVQIDINQTWGDQWGQYPVTQAPRLKEVAVNYRSEDWHQRFTFGEPRPESEIRVIVEHVTVNDPGTPAANVANYQLRTASGSYHEIVDTSPTLIVENTPRWLTWSAGPKGNRIGLHRSFVMRGTESEADWRRYDEMLRVGAQRDAGWATRYGIPVRKIGPAQLRVGEKGFCGHHDISLAWGESDHVDPGPGFPWDYYLQLVRECQASQSPELKEDEDMSFTDDDRRLLREVHRELTQRYPSRSAYRSTDETVDTLAGFVLNADARAHELWIMRLAEQQGISPQEMADRISGKAS